MGRLFSIIQVGPRQASGSYKRREGSRSERWKVRRLWKQTLEDVAPSQGMLADSRSQRR